MRRYSKLWLPLCIAARRLTANAAPGLVLAPRRRQFKPCRNRQDRAPRQLPGRFCTREIIEGALAAQTSRQLAPGVVALPLVETGTPSVEMTMNADHIV